MYHYTRVVPTTFFFFFHFFFVLKRDKTKNTKTKNLKALRRLSKKKHSIFHHHQLNFPHNIKQIIS